MKDVTISIESKIRGAMLGAVIGAELSYWYLHNREKVGAKTISDLEKPTIRNLIRSELINGFNNVLGQNAVQEIYITELAIQ